MRAPGMSEWRRWNLNPGRLALKPTLSPALTASVPGQAQSRGWTPRRFWGNSRRSERRGGGCWGHPSHEPPPASAHARRASPLQAREPSGCSCHCPNHLRGGSRSSPFCSAEKPGPREGLGPAQGHTAGTCRLQPPGSGFSVSLSLSQLQDLGQATRELGHKKGRTGRWKEGQRREQTVRLGEGEGLRLGRQEVSASDQGLEVTLRTCPRGL